MSCEKCSTPKLAVVHTDEQVHYLQMRIGELEAILEDVESCTSCPECAEMCRRALEG